jgi:hypothetical protein
MTARPAATIGYTSHGTPIRCGSWALKIRIASALTKPTITLRGMNRMRRATPTAASRIWKIPPRMTAAIRYCSPCSTASGATTSAMAPVAALIIAGRPPVKAMVTAMVNDAKSPTRGSTPARIEKLIASGISARATTRPARISVRATLGESQAGRLRAGRAEGMSPFSGHAPRGAEERPSTWPGVVPSLP